MLQLEDFIKLLKATQIGEGRGKISIQAISPQKKESHSAVVFVGCKDIDSHGSYPEFHGLQWV